MTHDFKAVALVDLTVRDLWTPNLWFGFNLRRFAFGI